MSEQGARPRSLPLGLRGWAAIAVLLGVVTVVNIAFIPDYALEQSATSYGLTGNGFGAAHDLLRELGFDVRRSRARYADVSVDQPLWLLAPEGVAGLRAWLEAGGTAVVVAPTQAVLAELDLELPSCASTLARPGVASGSLSARPIELDVATLFEPDDALETLLELEGKPFVALARVGAGHAVLVADVTPFTNEALLDADHARFVVELARAFGAPAFDERAHGLVNESTLLGALGPGRVAVLLSGLGLLVLVILWSARRVPGVALRAEPAVDSSLGQFVDALTQSYGRKGPRAGAEVYRAYVHGLRHRLRKAIYGRRQASDALLSERLQRELQGEPEVVRALEGRDEVRSAADLRRSVRRMESYLARGTWQSRRPFDRSKES